MLDELSMTISIAIPFFKFFVFSISFCGRLIANIRKNNVENNNSFGIQINFCLKDFPVCFNEDVDGNFIAVDFFDIAFLIINKKNGNSRMNAQGD